MNSEYLFDWQNIKNTVNERMSDGSLFSSLTSFRKINKQTKILNQKLKESQSKLQSYEKYLKLRKQVKDECENDCETEDEAIPNLEAYKKIHNEKYKLPCQTLLRYRLLGNKRPPPPKTSLKLQSLKPNIHKTPSKTNESIHRSRKSPISQMKLSKTKEIYKVNSCRKDGDTDEENCIKGIVEDLMSENIQAESLHKFSDPISKRKESSDIKGDEMVENLSEEIIFIKPRKRKKRRNVITEDTDESDVSGTARSSIKNVNKDNLVSRGDIRMNNNRESNSVERFTKETNNEEYIEASNRNSGNNSLSDTDVSRQAHIKNSPDEAVVRDDLEEEIYNNHPSATNGEKNIRCNNDPRLKENARIFNGTENPASLKNNSNIFEPKFESKISVHTERMTDSYAESEASIELPLCQPIRISHLKGKLSTESTPKEDRRKLKIRTIENYDKGFEIFSKHQSCEERKLTILNHSENESIESECLMSNEQQSESKKFSENCDLFRIESSQSKATQNCEDFIENQSLSKNAESRRATTFSEQCYVSLRESQHLNLSDHRDSNKRKYMVRESLSVDKGFLRSRKSFKNCNLSQEESHHLKESISHKDSTENKSPLEDEEFSTSGKFLEDCNSSQNESQRSYELIAHGNPLLLSKKNREDFNKSMNNSLLKIGELTADYKSPERPDISGSQTHQPIPSLNSSFSPFSARSYDKDVKDSVKIQLLSEIEQRLRDGRNSEKEKKSRAQSILLNGYLREEAQHPSLLANSNREDIDDKSINNQSLVENNAQALGNGSMEKCNLSKNKQQISKSGSDIHDASTSVESTPMKRQISKEDSDHCWLENKPKMRKLARLDKRINNSPKKLISCEQRSQESISNELQPMENEDDSPIQSLGELKTSRKVQRTSKKRYRPRNLEQFVTTEGLVQDTTKPYFRLRDIGDDDEIWIMDVPKSINPKDLQDQIILLGGKTKLNIGDECYKISSKPSTDVFNISCILATSRRKKQYKIVNVESKGSIKFRRKYDVISDTELIPSKKSAIPFPENLKIRHPLFGVFFEDKI